MGINLETETAPDDAGVIANAVVLTLGEAEDAHCVLREAQIISDTLADVAQNVGLEESAALHRDRTKKFAAAADAVRSAIIMSKA